MIKIQQYIQLLIIVGVAWLVAGAASIQFGLASSRDYQPGVYEWIKLIFGTLAGPVASTAFIIHLKKSSRIALWAGIISGVSCLYVLFLIMETQL